MASHYLHTEIEINASAEQVWAVLTDFPAYPEWNPFITSIEGHARHGERLSITIQPNEQKTMRFAPVVLSANVGRDLRWLGRFIAPGLFDGEHRFLIEPIDDGKVRLQHTEKFGGLLVLFLRRSLERDTRRGFERMNRALKERVEQATANE
jgi:hypothetical protein